MLNTSWKPGLSGWSAERKGEKLRSEVQSGVIKIHPTVQTKGGMKRGESCRGGRGVGKIWGEKKILSLSRSLNSASLLNDRL